MKNLILAFIITLVAGCASVPTPQELAVANHGSPMSQKECESAVREIMNGYLKDPYSVQYSFQRCQKGWMPSIPIMGLPIQYGYFIAVSINAKNSYGGYTGPQNYQFLFKNGRAIRKTSPGNNGYGQFPF